MKRILTWVSGPVLAIVFLWLCFRGADLQELARHARSASIPLLLVCIGTGILQMMLRAWRWGTLLEPVRPRSEIPYLERFSAISIGNMALILPGRVGEVLRPALLSRRVSIPFGTTLATVAVERLMLDLLAVLTFGAIGLLLPSRLSGLGSESDPEVVALLRSSGLVVLAATLGALFVISWAARRSDRLTGLLQDGAAATSRRLLRAILLWLVTLLPGLGALASRRGLTRLALETLMVWTVIASGVHIGIVACGVELAPFSVLLLVPVLAVGIAIPTPGGTGSYHAAMMLGLMKLFGTDEGVAQAAALVVHAVTLLPMLLMGAIFVALGGLTRKSPVPILSGAGGSES